MKSAKSDVNLNLLKVFNELYKSRNAKLTAKKLGITRTAVSKSLSRLRDELDDPLFVRVSNEFVPTSRAIAIGETLDAKLNDLYSLCLLPEEFDPKKANEKINIAVTPTLFEQIGGELLLELSKELPLVRFNLTNWDENTSEKIEKGDIQIGINLVPDGGSASHQFGDLFTTNKSLRETRIVSIPLAIVVRKDHRLADSEVRNEDLNGEQVAGLIIPELNRYQALFQQTYQRLGIDMRLRAESNLSLYHLVSKSNLVMITLLTNKRQLPQELTLKSMRNIKPLPIDKFCISSFHHTQNHQSPLYQWLISKVGEIISGVVQGQD